MKAVEYRLHMGCGESLRGRWDTFREPRIHPPRPTVRTKAPRSKSKRGPR